MDKINQVSSGKKWMIVIALGSIWGLSEAGMGMALRGACARMMTGSIMTGVAVFFMAASYSSSRRMISLLAILGIAAGFKLLDAFLLGLPVLHGAIGNPIFAFYTEIFAFILVWTILDSKLREKKHGRAMAGGLSALVAVNLFPLVKFATGVPACVVPGTSYPLALYYSPIAIALSAIACPAGMAAGEQLLSIFSNSPQKSLIPRLAPVVLRLTPALAIIAVVLLRIV